jgi:2-methylaconitate cis-trans-isomerase PrpF
VTAVPAVFMRGGQARGLLFGPNALPAAGPERDRVLVAAMGSPDPYGLQLDGMGSGTTSTSKCAIMSRSARPDADVDYLFAQVDVFGPRVDWTRSCGNLAAAAALYAVEEGLVSDHGDGPVPVVLWQANRAYRIRAGVQPLTGEVDLAFGPRDGGAAALFPAGGPLTVLEVPGVGKVAGTVVDATNPFTFVRAGDVGLAPNGDGDLPAVFARLEQVRRTAATAAGMSPDGTSPRVVLLDPPQDYDDLGGRRIPAADLDLLARTTSGRTWHHALPMSAAMAAAAAACVPGTVVADICGARGPTSRLRLGHPSGLASVGARVRDNGADWVLAGTEVRLTARRLMTGMVSVPGSSPLSV